MQIPPGTGCGSVADTPCPCLPWRDSAATPQQGGPLRSFYRPSCLSGCHKTGWLRSRWLRRGGGAGPKTTAPANSAPEAQPLRVSRSRVCGLCLSRFMDWGRCTCRSLWSQGCWPLTVLPLYHNSQPLCTLLLLTVACVHGGQIPPGLHLGSPGLWSPGLLPAACVSSSVERA